MALKEGEMYQCPNPDCGCEITVTKGAQPGGGGNQAPRCCCGMEMVKDFELRNLSPPSFLVHSKHPRSLRVFCFSVL
jgi:hypothetical protein